MQDQFERPRQRGNVLSEDEYLHRLELLIKRDFYPECYQMDKLKHGQEDEKLSLNEFLSTYTSEENVTLSDIIKKEDERWYQKNQWMFNAEDKYREQQLEICASNKLKNMLEGNRENRLALPEYKALNPLYFKIDKEYENVIEAVLEAKNEDDSLKVPRVQIQNTRFDDHHKPMDFAISQINEKHSLQQRRKLQERLNAQGVNVDFFGSTPALMGIHQQDDMLGIYSPRLKSPLMTWGEVAETPQRLDRTYMIPPSPARDRIGSSLATQLNVKKRIEQKQQQELLRKRLTSMTPNRMNSSLSSRANSELLKNFFGMRAGSVTPMALKSKKIQK